MAPPLSEGPKAGPARTINSHALTDQVLNTRDCGRRMKQLPINLQFEIRLFVVNDGGQFHQQKPVRQRQLSEGRQGMRQVQTPRLCGYGIEATSNTHLRQTEPPQRQRHASALVSEAGVLSGRCQRSESFGGRVVNQPALLTAS